MPAPSRDRDPDLDTLAARLTAELGEQHAERIRRGLGQIAPLWRPEDGDLEPFAREHFITDPKALSTTLARFSAAMELLDGHYQEMELGLRWHVDVDTGEILPVDALFAAMNPAAHQTEDLFAAKAAFVALLNFPLRSLADQERDGASYTTRDWAETRLTERFATRVPAVVEARIAEVGAGADLYISNYNIWMHHVLTEEGERLFPLGKRLISHWNLRDEIKAAYGDPRGLTRQRLIVRVMERIVTQTIPQAVINNPRLDWKPESNTTADAVDVEADAPPAPPATEGPEPDTRYEHWLNQFHAARALDPFAPTLPTAIARSFEKDRRLTEDRAVALLEAVLRAPVAQDVAASIAERLARPLQTHDIWYNGFKPETGKSEAALDAITQERYPSTEAFARDIPRILRHLGFPAERAAELASLVEVDDSRGAGHAAEARRRGDKPHLRTRVGAKGMDYKGYNIAVHELGHNIEQIITLYDVEDTLLQGVPNNAFTEAVAFVFQARDLELLGLPVADTNAEHLETLDAFWKVFEIAGVALVDVGVWHWLYDHPEATPAELRDAALRIAEEVWNRYFAPVIGVRDSPLLAIYSHLVAYPLYTAHYALGYLVAFQLEEHFAGTDRLGPEIERVMRQGSITPDLWMQRATGQTLSAEPLLAATARAVAAMK